MPSRRITDLHPELRVLYPRWEAACEKAGVTVLVTCTYRSQAEQDELYAQGRTKPGKKVTWTRTSRHSETINGHPAASAWDFVPIIAGKAVWSSTHPAWQIAGKIAEDLGLEWGGSWLKNKDFPHIQMRRKQVASPATASS